MLNGIKSVIILLISFLRDTMTFAESVRITRTKLNLTQEALAHELGVSFATVNRWENGSYNPSRLAQKAFQDFCKNNHICVEDNDE